MKKKHQLIGKERVYDQELMYACVIVLLQVLAGSILDDVVAYAFAAYEIPNQYSIQN